MNIGQQILFFVSGLGAFNGILLSLYLFFNRQKRSLAAKLLGVLLLALSIRVTKSVFLYFNPGLPKIYLQAGLSACFLIGPSLYYFLRAAMGPVTRVPAAWKWSWGIQLGILLAAGLAWPYESFPGAWNNLFAYIIYCQWGVWLAAAGFLLKNAIRRLFANPAALSGVEKFWLMLYLGNCIIYLAYVLSWVGVVYGMYISGPISFSLMLYLTVGFSLHKSGLEHTPAPARAEKRKIAENDALLWAAKLEKAVLDNDLYKDPNLKLNDLAQKINIPGHQLSQLLNDNLGKSFSTFINEYRINEACRLIATNDRLTFEAIGYEVGYNSKSTFYAAFRKIKDTTPALYKESIEKSVNK